MAEVRINPQDDVQSAIMKLAEGNPGALRVCCDLFKATPEVDPQAGFGGYTPLLFLDTLNVYGSEIWMLYKDVCGEDIRKTIAVLRACQLGFVSRERLRAVIAGLEAIDLDDLCRRVTNRLPQFKLSESHGAMSNP